MTEREAELRIGGDGIARCWWPGEAPDYVEYHDTEWGRPVIEDTGLFEKICLEGFQAGLSWITILRKRENFRAAWAGFEIASVAAFGEADVERMLGDAGIVRHQGKIRSAINNAGRAGEMIDEFGSLAAYFWAHEPAETETDHNGGGPWSVPVTTPTSVAIAKDLKKRGWSFVGPTTVYAFMQAVGLVNDHQPGCAAREQCQTQRNALNRPTLVRH